LALLFIVEMKVIFPLFRPAGFRHLRYEALGDTGGEIVTTVLTQPFFALSLLWTPASKIDGLLSPLSSVAFLALLAPRWLLALAPIVLERFWSTHQNRWWGFHYGAGAGVLSVLATIHGLSWLRARLAASVRPAVMGCAITAALVSTLLVSVSLRQGPPLLRWRHGYYTTPEDRRDASSVLSVIPADASVAAQNHLIPHLSARHEIFELRRPIRAQFVAIDFAQSPWPFDKRYLRTLSQELLGQSYGAVACAGEAVVLERGAVSVTCPALE
jgi:hypothetical protein